MSAGAVSALPRILRVRRGAGGSAAQCAGNRTQRGPDHNPHRAGHRDADGGARGRAGHHAATHQHRVGLALGFLGFQRSLRRGIRVLRRNAVAGAGLLGKIFVDRCGVGRRGGQWVHVLLLGKLTMERARDSGCKRDG